MTGLSDTHTRPLWRDRRFATYWSGQTVSQLGDRISELALPLIAVTTLHASAAEVGVLTAAIWAPNLLSLVVGAWVDHQRRKRRLLVVANLIQAARSLVLPVAHLAGFMSMWQLYAVALVLGAGRRALPDLLPAVLRRAGPPRPVPQANTLLSATRSGVVHRGSRAGRAAHPGAHRTGGDGRRRGVVRGLGAADRLGPGRRTAGRDRRTRPGLLRRSRDGWASSCGTPTCARRSACATTINLFYLMAGALLILFASRELGPVAGVIGLALGIGAVGGLLGTVVAGPLSRRIGVGRTIALGAVVFSAPFALHAARGRADLVAGGRAGAGRVHLGVGVMCSTSPSTP